MMIRFDNVVKKFDGRAVLDGVSFTVEKGEILAVVGPSGTGKSVTLKHVVGLLTPTSGTVEVDPSARIDYLFQGGALLAWLSVYDNVALPLRETTDYYDDEIDRRVMAALNSVGLSEAAEKFPAEISGGMAKRAGLARAIVREADVILYDEPTSGLDPVTAATINRLIRHLNRSRGITSVVVTHDLVAALSFADRLMMVKDGRVVLAGSPDDFRNSNIPEVKEFLAAGKGEI